MSEQRELACDEAVALVTEYLEGAMAPEDRARFEAHMRECEGCDVYLEQMRASVRLCGRVPVGTLTPEARETFLAALRGWKRGDTAP